MIELLRKTAWLSTIYVLPALHLIAIAYLVVHRRWSTCWRVVLSFLLYVACAVVGYMLLLGILFGFFGCVPHGGCGFESSWPFSLLVIACGIYFLARLRKVLIAYSLK
jgi:ABC-type molybdate transport system permease subunit